MASASPSACALGEGRHATQAQTLAGENHRRLADATYDFESGLFVDPQSNPPKALCASLGRKGASPASPKNARAAQTVQKASVKKATCSPHLVFRVRAGTERRSAEGFVGASSISCEVDIHPTFCACSPFAVSRLCNEMRRRFRVGLQMQMPPELRSALFGGAD